MALTLAEAKQETVRIQKSLVALIPEELCSPDRLPAPGSVKMTPVVGSDGSGFRYPGSAAVRLVKDADGQAIVELLEQELRTQGWQETPMPTVSQPKRRLFANAVGYETIISTIDRSDDLPMVVLDVWSPPATAPENFNRFVDKI